LPLPDREIWEEWVSERKKNISVLLSRGCPFQCTYCCNHALATLAPGRYVRLRSPDRIVDEIRETLKRYPAKKEIFLEAEDLGANKEWAIKLCSRLEDLNAALGHSLSFEANLRITPNANLSGLFAACKNAGFKALDIGLESGSERIRYEILRRNHSNEDLIHAVHMAKKYGLNVNLYVMIGLPGETLADFWQTVRVARTCLPDKFHTFIFFPYPGTDIYRFCNEQGLLNPVNNDMERKKAALNLPGFGKEQVEKSYVWFDYYVYRGTKNLFRILAKVLWTRFIVFCYPRPYGNILLTRIERLAFTARIRNIF
jgi:anaerobic magnesium-protoporphyrin IX monomethyl ester cyclase